jgi:hypothetical protein
MYGQLVPIQRLAIASRCSGPRYSGALPTKSHCILHVISLIALVHRFARTFIPVDVSHPIHFAGAFPQILERKQYKVPTLSLELSHHALTGSIRSHPPLGCPLLQYPKKRNGSGSLSAPSRFR